MKNSSQNNIMKIAVLFAVPQSGHIEVKYGKLLSAGQFYCTERVEIELENDNPGIGCCSGIVRVRGGEHPFSFFARDVNSSCPIYIPEFGAAAVPLEDPRDYAAVAAAISAKGLISDFERMTNEPEESYQHAAQLNRNKISPTWLGFGRDMRIFRIQPQQTMNSTFNFNEDYQYWGMVTPMLHTSYHRYGEHPRWTWYQIHFEIGPGVSCRPVVSRRLEEGVLPILHSCQDEQQIQYHITAFSTLENGPLDPADPPGTEAMTALVNTGNSMFSAEEHDAVKANELISGYDSANQAVCVIRVEAVNVAKTPSYAWFRAPHVPRTGNHLVNGLGSADAFGKLICTATRINGLPLPQQEIALLLQPGEHARLEMLIPHSPLPETRARKLLEMDTDVHLAAANRFFKQKLESAKLADIPETAIHERLRAGLLHLDINTLGEDTGPLLPTVGWYGPIGTESSPVIQFYDSVGLHDIARRCIDFFLMRQHEDGFMQNYHNYQSETGPVLWTIGEHFRYTRNLDWLTEITPEIKKSCDYLLAWRERNKTPEAEAVGGYGLLSGKVADPDDFFHAFFLNAGTYLGLKRMAECLQHTDREYAEKLSGELKLYRQDLRNAAAWAQSNAPVTPLQDGSWVPQLPPWTENSGATSIYADGGNWFSHGTFMCRDTIIGALWLGIAEIFDYQDLFITMLLKANQHPSTRENAGLSQPYYFRHDFMHLKRGETKLFLKTFYNQMTALQDRETYSFWEHYHGASEHKTHEESWFLMQIRWMLYIERDDSTLELFKAIPREWLENGKKLAINGMKSYFGSVTASVELNNDIMECSYSVERTVDKVLVRLPHPAGIRPRKISGGEYDPESETVQCCGNEGYIRLEF